MQDTKHFMLLFLYYNIIFIIPVNLNYFYNKNTYVCHICLSVYKFHQRSDVPNLVYIQRKLKSVWCQPLALNWVFQRLNLIFFLSLIQNILILFRLI